MSTHVSRRARGRLALVPLGPALVLGGCAPLLPYAALASQGSESDTAASADRELSTEFSDPTAAAPAEPSASATAPAPAPSQSPEPIEVILEDKGPTQPSPGSHEAAGAVVDAYLAAMVHGMRTLDTSALEDISDADCRICVAHIGLIRAFARDGVTVPPEVDWYALEMMVVEEPDGQGLYSVLARTVITDPRVADVAAVIGPEYIPGDSWAFLVRPTAQGWVVDNGMAIEPEKFEEWWDQAAPRAQ